jgi:hypothetical protein
MIRAALNTTKGPIGIIGINQENFMRMKAGMPLNINLQEITPKGARMNRVIIHYADTYEQVVDDLIAGDIPDAEKLRPAAKEMDARIKKEQEERG